MIPRTVENKPILRDTGAGPEGELTIRQRLSVNIKDCESPIERLDGSGTHLEFKPMVPPQLLEVVRIEGHSLVPRR